MRKIILYISLASVLITLFTTACTDKILDEIDRNPNSPGDVPLSVLLPQVEVDVVVGVSGTDLAWYSSVFVEHTTGVHGQLETADKRTGINSTIGNNSWNGIYADALQDLSVIVKKGTEEEQWVYVGIAKILQAYTFGVATDLWGRVPFTQAIQGAENANPAFDTQESIYAGLQALLDEAIADLAKESAGNPGNADFFYGGDASLWTKAAWGLKAVYHNRLSNINPQTSATNALAAVANSFKSPAESLVFDDFTTEATGQNPWFQELNERSHHAVSVTMDNLLLSYNDPRRDIWFGKVNGEISPAPNGTAISDQGGTIYSRAASGPGAYLSATSPIPILTYDELKFIEAEAHLRLNDRPAAYQAYQAAVSQALVRAGVAPADTTAYLAQPSVSPGQAALSLGNIIQQKYISFWLFQPIQAYNDYRRTGYPTLMNPIGPAPLRFPYPQDEVAANGANVPPAGTQNGVWWDDTTED